MTGEATGVYLTGSLEQDVQILVQSLFNLMNIVKFMKLWSRLCKQLSIIYVIYIYISEKKKQN